MRNTQMQTVITQTSFAKQNKLKAFFKKIFSLQLLHLLREGWLDAYQLVHQLLLASNLNKFPVAKPPEKKSKVDVNFSKELET